MKIEKKEKRGTGVRGGIGEGMAQEGEGRRIGEEEVFRRVLRSVRSGAEDKEAFEELRRINKERREEHKERAKELGKELYEESCKKEYSLDKVVMLVLEGADLEFKDDYGWTALMRAALNSKKDAVKVMLENGANPFLKSNKGRKAIDFAGDEETKGLLREFISKMDKRVKERMEREAELRFSLIECNKEKAKGLMREVLSG
ncbi:MAG: ankyrin repeat domain-containing protein [Candidatus Anstonellales archaeon]